MLVTYKLTYIEIYKIHIKLNQQLRPFTEWVTFMRHNSQKKYTYNKWSKLRDVVPISFSCRVKEGKEPICSCQLCAIRNLVVDTPIILCTRSHIDHYASEHTRNWISTQFSARFPTLLQGASNLKPCWRFIGMWAVLTPPQSPLLFGSPAVRTSARLWKT